MSQYWRKCVLTYGSVYVCMWSGIGIQEYVCILFEITQKFWVYVYITVTINADNDNDNDNDLFIDSSQMISDKVTISLIIRESSEIANNKIIFRVQTHEINIWIEVTLIWKCRNRIATEWSSITH